MMYDLNLYVLLRRNPFQSSKLLLVLASTVVLGFMPVGTRGHDFVLSRLLCVLKWDLLFDERRDLERVKLLFL
jgi:hypothetical protein